jgi:large subunit ribosomal protein L24
VEGETAAKLKVRSNEQGHRQFVYNKGDQEVVYRSVKKPK